MLTRNISIHVPSWGTTYNYNVIFMTNVFQSTFPRGERLNSLTMFQLLDVFQSTFPRGERRHRSYRCEQGSYISIHVPSWGTTECLGENAENTSISIHVPSWGTTRISRYNLEEENISIHVPSWGTTTDNATLHSIE